VPDIVVSPENRRTKEFSPKEWQERIRNGQRFQLQFANANKWHMYKRYYRHEFNGKVIPVNLYFSLLRSMVPQIYFKNPSVTVTPRRPGLQAELNARIVQELDNWLLQELMTKSEMKKMIADAFFTGTSAGFIGYDSEYGLDPTKLDPTNQFSLTQFDRKGFRTEYNANVNPGMPWFLRARPEDVIWPWGTESAQNAEWVALRVFRPLEDVKADPKYSNTKDLTGTFVPLRSQPEGGIHRGVPEHQGLERDRVWTEIFQIHDVRTGKILAVTMDHDKFLRNQRDDLQIDGLPVETLSFNPDPDFIYGVPDSRIIEPQQLELNEIRTQAMKHRRIEVIKAIVKKGLMSEEEIQKMTDEQVMGVLQIDAETSSLRESVITFTPNASGILADLGVAAEQIRADVREMVGFSRIAQGEFQGKTHISATETQAVFRSLNIRLDERRDMMADLLTRVVRRFNQIIFTQWNEERVSRVIGPDGAQWWLKYKGTEIKDEYNLKVTPEEGPEADTETKFSMAERAAVAWAQLNQGQIAQGVPVPQEIQRLLFNPIPIKWTRH
jgi:hypothetical protein